MALVKEGGKSKELIRVVGRCKTSKYRHEHDRGSRRFGVWGSCCVYVLKLQLTLALAE